MFGHIILSWYYFLTTYWHTVAEQVKTKFPTNNEGLPERKIVSMGRMGLFFGHNQRSVESFKNTQCVTCVWTYLMRVCFTIWKLKFLKAFVNRQRWCYNVCYTTFMTTRINLSFEQSYIHSSFERLSNRETSNIFFFQLKQRVCWQTMVDSLLTTDRTIRAKLMRNPVNKLKKRHTHNDDTTDTFTERRTTNVNAKNFSFRLFSLLLSLGPKAFFSFLVSLYRSDSPSLSSSHLVCMCYIYIYVRVRMYRKFSVWS